MVHAQSLLDETLLAFCEEADLALEGTFAKLLASVLGVVMTVAHQNLMTRTNHFSPLRKILPTNTEIAVVIAASVAVADCVTIPDPNEKESIASPSFLVENLLDNN